MCYVQLKKSFSYFFYLNKTYLYYNFFEIFSIIIFTTRIDLKINYVARFKMSSGWFSIRIFHIRFIRKGTYLNHQFLIHFFIFVLTTKIDHKIDHTTCYRMSSGWLAIRVFIINFRWIKYLSSFYPEKKISLNSYAKCFSFW